MGKPPGDNREPAWAGVLRAVHIGLSMFGLAGLVFFAVTGVMLNHGLVGQSQVGTTYGQLPVELVGPPPGPPATMPHLNAKPIVARLRDEFGIRGELGPMDFDELTIHVPFTESARRTEVVIDRLDGRVVITVMHRGPAGWLTNLHRGRAPGRAWSWAVDVMAIVLLLTAGSGGLLLARSARWGRRLGLIGLAVGIVALIVAYLALTM